MIGIVADTAVLLRLRAKETLQGFWAMPSLAQRINLSARSRNRYLHQLFSGAPEQGSATPGSCETASVTISRKVRPTMWWHMAVGQRSNARDPLFRRREKKLIPRACRVLEIKDSSCLDVLYPLALQNSVLMEAPPRTTQPHSFCAYCECCLSGLLLDGYIN
jgi:hypothetical protein